MAKKKTSSSVDYLAGYVPASFSPAISAQQILQIPPYPDTGIEYKGYAKDLRGGNYILSKQATRFYSQANSNVASPSTITISRPNQATAIFYCSGILIQSRMSSVALAKYLDIQDGSAISPRLRVFLWGNAINDITSMWLDLSTCPRKFDGNIAIYYPDGLSNLEFVHVELFGWDETR